MVLSSRRISLSICTYRSFTIVQDDKAYTIGLQIRLDGLDGDTPNRGTLRPNAAATGIHDI